MFGLRRFAPVVRNAVQLRSFAAAQVYAFCRLAPLSMFSTRHFWIRVLLLLVCLMLLRISMPLMLPRYVARSALVRRRRLTVLLISRKIWVLILWMLSSSCWPSRRSSASTFPSMSLRSFTLLMTLSISLLVILKPSKRISSTMYLQCCNCPLFINNVMNWIIIVIVVLLNKRNHSHSM